MTEMDSSCYIPNNPDYGLREQQQQEERPEPHHQENLECHCWNISTQDTQQISTGQQQSNNFNADKENVIQTHLNEEEDGTITVCWANGEQQQLQQQQEQQQEFLIVADNGVENEMNSFSLPLDLDPLSTLFPFSPCNTSGVYKADSNCSPLVLTKEKPVHNMADVLLSLKHAVVHPGQSDPVNDISYHVHQQQPPQHQSHLQHQHPHQHQHQQQMSYTVHPHQMLMSPNGYTYCDQLPPPPPPATQSQHSSNNYHHYHHHHHHHQPASNVQMQPTMFPSMSVNVSMNMTYHPTTLPSYEQMQWATMPQTTSPGFVPNQSGLLSPTYSTGGAAYSFTADFRTPAASQSNMQDVPLITSTSSFKPLLNSKTQFTVPVKPNRKISYVNTGRLQMVYEDDDDLEMQKPNLCRICGKTYARPSTLKTHLRTHSGEKPYRCIDCNKSFSQAANLTAHVRTHSGEKPFLCPICDRRFSQSSSVTTHMRTHSGERPYRCRMCKKAFSDSSTLTKHLRIHSGEKPYQCKLCLLRFSQSGNLNRHMRVHGGAGNTASNPNGHENNGILM